MDSFPVWVSRCSTPRSLVFAAIVVWSVVIRVALVGFADIVSRHPDSSSYLQGPDFGGGQWRTWVYPLMNALLPYRWVVAVQAVVSAVAFACLAATVAGQLKAVGLRILAYLVVLVVGFSERIVMWDGMILSESLSLSLTALLIAAFVSWRWLPVWAWLVLLTAWLFVRDANLYLGFVVVAAVLVVARRRLSVVLAGGAVLILAWAVVASQRNHDSERYAVTVNVAYHTMLEPEYLEWFVVHDMPITESFFFEDFASRNYLLQRDDRFQQWVAESGASTYVKFLLQHPSFALGGIERLFVDGGLNNEAFVDRPYWTDPLESSAWWTPNGDLARGIPWVIPKDGTYVMLALLAFAAMASLIVVLRGPGLDRRWTIPSVLLASVVPQTLLAYHGTPWEVGRHGVVITLSLAVSSMWITLLAADQWWSRRGPGPGSVVGVEGGVEFAPGAVTGAGDHLAGLAVPDEHHPADPRQFTGLDHPVGGGDRGAGRDVQAGFEDTVVAQADPDPGVGSQEAPLADGDDVGPAA